MIKEIQFGGISATPDDYQSTDGDLDSAINLIPEDNQLKPLFPPSSLCTLPRHCSVVYIHKTNSYSHFIVFAEDNNSLYFIDQDEASGGIVRMYDDSIAFQTGDVALHPELSFIRFVRTHVAGSTLSGFEFFLETRTYPTLSYFHTLSTSICQINAIGNILLILTPDGPLYFFWKNDYYQYLGNHIPELPLSFGLQGTPVSTSEFSAGTFQTSDNLHVPFVGQSFDLTSYGNSFSSQLSTLSGNILSKVNKFIKEEATDKGKSIMPFFVCYAFRLYDGSLTMRSVPVLMIPNSGCTPQVIITDNSTTTGSTAVTNGVSENRYLSIKAKVGAMVCDLDYACIDASALNNLRTYWSDIVKSVDIFISAPIFTYDQSENASIIGFESKSPFPEYTISFCRRPSETCTVDNGSLSATAAVWKALFYRKTEVAPLVFNQYDSDTTPTVRFILPTRKEQDVLNDIRERSNFYLLKSLQLDEIDCIDYSHSTSVLLTSSTVNPTQRVPTSPRTIIQIDEGFLDALVSKEDIEMAKELDSHDTIVATFSYVYNQRLNLANISKKIDMPFHPATLFPFCQPSHGFTSALSDDTSAVTFTYGVTFSTDIYLELYPDSKTIIVKSPSCPCLNLDALFPFLYYPNINAKRAYIVKEQSGDTLYGTTHQLNIITIPLTTHANLNGAVFFEGWDPNPSQTGWLSDRTIPYHPLPALTTDNLIPSQNKLYTSEVNNPFFFPATGINTISSGAILGISSAAKALSQGQFGQFPLYAFTSEGVWALEVASNGTFSARQPITRDVCSNPDGITQLDSAVLFPTARGLMLLSGSEAVCISDPIATEHPFDFLSLPSASHLHSLLGHPSDSCFPTQPFSSFLDGCRLIYDYLHQHIIVYNPSLSYAYVYSLKSKLWGMMHSSLSSSLNSYPDALAMDSNRHLVSFSSTDQSLCQTLFLTRPLKLDAHDSLKSIRTLILRGSFKKGDAQVALYASRDLYHWHLVGSSTTHTLRHLRGTPYKYFRLAVIASLSPDKSIASLSIDADLRASSKLI